MPLAKVNEIFNVSNAVHGHNLRECNFTLSFRVQKLDVLNESISFTGLKICNS